MRRLIWGFAGCTYPIVGNLMHWLKWCISKVTQCNYHAGSFYILHFLSNKLAGSQSLTCMYMQSWNQCRSWSVGFFEASWSGSTLFSKPDISRLSMVRVKMFRWLKSSHRSHWIWYTLICGCGISSLTREDIEWSLIMVPFPQETTDMYFMYILMTKH